jgi:thioredoxin-related protein
MNSLFNGVNKKDVFIFGLPAILLIVNFLLLKQTFDLRLQVKESVEVLPKTKLSALNGLDAVGEPVKIAYEGERKKTLLFIYSGACGFCDRNMRNWQSIASRIKPESFRLYTLTMSKNGALNYLAKYGLQNVPSIVEIDPQDIIEYKLRVTPQTILISENGVVEKVWSGVIDEAQVPEIETLLGLMPQ